MVTQSAKKLVWYGSVASSVLILLTVGAAAYGLFFHQPDLPKVVVELVRVLLRIQLLSMTLVTVFVVQESVTWLDVDRKTAFLFRVGASLAAGVLVCAVYSVALREPASFELAKLLARWLTGLVPVGILGLLLFEVGHRLFGALNSEGPPRFERNWGTLGNGAQGWRLSISLTYLLMFLSVAGLFGYALQSLLSNLQPAAAEAPPGSAPASGQAKATEAKTGETKAAEQKAGETKKGGGQ